MKRAKKRKDVRTIDPGPLSGREMLEGRYSDDLPGELEDGRGKEGLEESRGAAAGRCGEMCAYQTRCRILFRSVSVPSLQAGRKYRSTLLSSSLGHIYIRVHIRPCETGKREGGGCRAVLYHGIVSGIASD